LADTLFPPIVKLSAVVLKSCVRPEVDTGELAIESA